MRIPIAVAALAATVLAGCGATEPPSQTQTAAAAKPTATKPAAAKPATKKPVVTKRAQMVKCLEGVGWETESPTGDATEMLRVKSPAGHPVAVILFYATVKAAARSAADGRADGIAAASFGKAEVNYFGKTIDRASADAKVLTGCVTTSYGAA